MKKLISFIIALWVHSFTFSQSATQNHLEQKTTPLSTTSGAKQTEVQSQGLSTKFKGARPTVNGANSASEVHDSNKLSSKQKALKDTENQSEDKH